MKREGRQHGVVRSYAILPTPLSHRRYVKTVDSTSVAGIFAKVSRKPTNQSKFTGKCGTARCVGCHIHPASKSKGKAKGTRKLRSIGSNFGLTASASGNSATGVLAYLANDESYDRGDEHEEAVDDYDYDYRYDYGYDTNSNVEYGIGLASIVTEEYIGGEDDDEEDDESMSYCDVGLCWGEGDEDEHGDDGWYLVGHIQQ